EQAFGLHGPPDDDQTNQRVLRLTSANVYPQPWSVDEQIAQPKLPVDFEQWTNPNEPLLRPFVYPQPWAGEQNGQAFGLHGLPDDDLTRQSLLRLSQANVYPQPWNDTQGVRLYGLADEDFIWQNPLKPLVTAFIIPQQAAFDEQYVPKPLPSDDTETRQ